MLELTEPLQKAIDTQPAPLRLSDPRTQKEYVLVEAELFDRLARIVQDDHDVRAAYPLLDKIARREGWADPEMDIYNDYATKTT